MKLQRPQLQPLTFALLFLVSAAPHLFGADAFDPASSHGEGDSSSPSVEAHEASAKDVRTWQDNKAVGTMLDELFEKRKAFVSQLHQEATEIQTKLDAAKDSEERRKLMDGFRLNRQSKIVQFQGEEKLLEAKIQLVKRTPSGFSPEKSSQ